MTNSNHPFGPATRLAAPGSLHGFAPCEPQTLYPSQGPLNGQRRGYCTVEQAVESNDASDSPEFNQVDIALIAGFESDRLTRWHIQAHADRRVAVELERTVRLEEVKV